MSLSDRIRPNVEASPWVIDEIKVLEKQLTEAREIAKKYEDRYFSVREKLREAFAEYGIKIP